MVPTCSAPLTIGTLLNQLLCLAPPFPQEFFFFFPEASGTPFIIHKGASPAQACLYPVINMTVGVCQGMVVMGTPYSHHTALIAGINY